MKRRAFITPRIALRVWGKSRNGLLALCLLAGGIGVFASYAGTSGYLAQNREQPGNKEAKQPPAVAALGRIEPSSEIINIGAGLSPDRLESLFVARGDLVKKDQVLGYLGGYAEQIAQQDMYRAQLEEAKLRLKTEIELNRSRIEAAEIHQRTNSRGLATADPGAEGDDRESRGQAGQR